MPSCLHTSYRWLRACTVSG